MDIKKTVLGAIVAGCGAFSAQAATLPSDWIVNGNAGYMNPQGVVTAPPQQGPGYYYVSTWDAPAGVGALPGVGGSGLPMNGSTVATGLFSSNAGDMLNFFFNYVTSDGAGYADYGWARLLNSVGDQVALLFTARTTPGGSSVPGFSMPDPEATLSPATVTITPGGPVWDALGSNSGACFDNGCGYTGWVQSSYTIQNPGEYRLEFGVTNWNDQIFASAMAFAGATIGDVVITPPTPAPVPLPASGLLLLAGLGAVGAIRRQRAA